jgi:glucokinase
MLRRYEERTGVEAGSVVELLGRMEVGDADAQAVWDHALSALGRALADYTLLLDPALIVIGGGIAGYGSALLTPLRQMVEASLVCRSAPAMIEGAFGASAGCAGAGLLAWEQVLA